MPPTCWPMRVSAPITVMPTRTRMSPYSVWAWPAWPRRENRFIMITRPILGERRSRTMGGMARFATERSGRRLLRNPYPAFADAARNRFELGVHFELRQDVLDVRPHGVGRHPKGGGNRLVVVSERQLAQDLQLTFRERGRWSGLVLFL